MGKLIVTEFVSLDGVMEAPGGEAGYAHTGWVSDFFDAGVGEYKTRETLDSEALLLGRVTYESFAGAWPDRDDPQGFAAKMNAMPKHVVTSSTEPLAWNNTQRVEGELATAIPALKEQTDLIVHGSGRLVHALLGLGLVDELRLMVFPIVLGSGLRWFPEQPDTIKLALADTKAFDSGVTVQTYVRP